MRSKAGDVGSSAFAQKFSSTVGENEHPVSQPHHAAHRSIGRNVGPILFEAAGRHRSEASRRLVWTLFADSDDRKRDFLWREDKSGRFYVLSRRAPEDRHSLFTVETKAFEPVLAPGDRLAFSLRANATVARPRGDTKRAGKRDDVVMAALKDVPKDARADRRKEIIQREGQAWLKRQGEAAGFDFKEGEVAVDSYEPVAIRNGPSGALRLSILEFDGMLTVGVPHRLLAKIASGFGRGKAFGLGLMLIKRSA
jgi:CRISPR system Cascade subunit CasE